MFGFATRDHHTFSPIESCRTSCASQRERVRLSKAWMIEIGYPGENDCLRALSVLAAFSLRE